VSAHEDAVAATLDGAARSRHAIPQFSATQAFDVAAAYRIQARLIERRLERGERRIGVKLGFTSRAKMAQMGVHELICGQLTDAMRVPDGGQVALDQYIHPRAEPEIAFLLGSRLAGRVSLGEARDAVRSIAPAIEIIDSRYANFRFNLADVIADNCSSAALVLGSWRPLDLDIGDQAVTLTMDARVVQTGSTAAILGHPLQALVEAAQLVEKLGYALEPGWIVMAGAATAAEPLRPAMRVAVAIDSIGAASFTCRGGEV
jgi:2-oxo-3-hexenedioate decarboxylase